MTATHIATCNCGSVRIIANGPPLRIGLCHCTTCRKGKWRVHGKRPSGLPIASRPRADLKLEGGDRRAAFLPVLRVGSNT